MGYFMPHDTGKLFFFPHGIQQPGVNKYMPGRCGKGIVNILINYMKVVFKRLRRQSCQNPLADFVYIGDDHGVINYIKVLVYHRHHLARHIFFLFDRDTENRR